MKLNPIDIRNQQFKSKTFGGIDPDEVRSFLNQVAQDFEELTRESLEHSERLRIAQEQIAHYQSIEKTLQDTAVTMQKVLEQKTQDAHREADLIIAEAKNQAEKEVASIRAESAQLITDIQVLKDQKRNFFIRFKSLLDSQSQMVQALEDEPS
jgi:cell division initiation protein